MADKRARSRLRFSIVTVAVLAALLGPGRVVAAGRQDPRPGGPVAVGDIVKTGIRGQNVIGEVIRAFGDVADLEFGQNNVSTYLKVEFMTVLQRKGSVPKAPFNPGDVVQVPYIAGTTLQGAIMKVNGAYCEIDSSGSGFTGWNLCSELRVIRRAPPPALLSIASGIAAPAGANNPLAGQPFFLLKESLDTALTRAGVRPEPGTTPIAAWQLACKTQAPLCQQGLAAIGTVALAGVRLDREGKGQFTEGVPAGVYYLFGSYAADSQTTRMWHVRVDLKSGENMLKLEQSNSTAVAK